MRCNKGTFCRNYLFARSRGICRLVPECVVKKYQERTSDPWGTGIYALGHGLLRCLALLESAADRSMQRAGRTEGGKNRGVDFVSSYSSRTETSPFASCNDQQQLRIQGVAAYACAFSCVP